MKEYSNEYTGLNDWKVLFHRKHLESIVDGNLLPPVAVDTDPSNFCNQKCIYCNAYEYRKDVGFGNLPEGHLLKLADFYKDWGVKSTCIAGGGESLMNKETKKMIPKLYKNDIETSMITNGALLDEEYSDILTDGSRFCGISIDGANKETYKLIRGKDNFDIVKKNVIFLNNVRIFKNSNLDVNLKFLIHPYNYTQIYDIAKLAKEWGCNGIHIRPCGLDNVPGVENPMAKWTEESKNDYLKTIDDIIEKTWELVDENFNVYSVRHKFSSKLQTVVKFEKCRCTPLAGVFGADGWFHLCFSARGRKGFRLARHIPDPWNVAKVWGSKYHLDLIKNIDPKECMRCAFTRYNEVIENCIMEDKMFKNFL